MNHTTHAQLSDRDFIETHILIMLRVIDRVIDRAHDFFAELIMRGVTNITGKFCFFKQPTNERMRGATGLEQEEINRRWIQLDRKSQL